MFLLSCAMATKARARSAGSALTCLWRRSQGLGITLFGMAYMFVHDGLVHRRFPVGPIENVPYFRRVAAAHQVRSGSVAFSSASACLCDCVVTAVFLLLHACRYITWTSSRACPTACSWGPRLVSTELN